MVERAKSPKPTTLKDIAEYVGTSINTASCVLNPRRIKVQVSTETRRAILDAARKLNYQRNVSASRLAGGQTRTIGILMDRITHAFDAPVTDAFEREVVRRGYQCFIGCTRSDGLEKLNYVKRLAEHGVDGMLLTTVWDDPDVKEALHSILNNNTPVVFVDFAWKKNPGALVSGNHFQGGQLLAQHLIDEGHRSFAFLSEHAEAEKNSVKERLRGVRSVLKAHGMDPSCLKLYMVTLQEMMAAPSWGDFLSSYVMARQNEPNPPTGVICIHDMLAYHLITGLWEKGVRVPDHLAVTGYDDLHFSFLQTLGFQDSTPFPWMVPLTTVRQPFAEIGQSAARILIDEIEKEKESSPKVVQLDVKLIVRESSRLPLERAVLAAR